MCFFFKQKTAYEMRMSDWSSDVCSSDLVDFLRISKNAKVTVSIPVRFVDEEKAPGIKRGGVLNIVRHELELVLDAAHIPDEIEISLEGLDVGDAVHVSKVALPEGATPVIDDRDFTIATVVAPSALKSSEGDNETEGATEGEAEAGAEGATEGAGEEG